MPILAPAPDEGGQSSLIAALVAGSEAEIAEQLTPVVEAFVGNAMFRFVTEEALVAIAVTAVFFGLAFASPYLPDVTWALAAALVVLLWYLVHFLQGVAAAWPLARSLILLRGAPVFRFALFVLARHAITTVEARIEEVGRTSTFVPRMAIRAAQTFYQDDRDRVALALADALAQPVRRELIRAATLGLLPLLVVMFGFRSALMWKAGFYGVAHMAWWELLLLPFRGGIPGG
jgi:hypothetical protein